MIEDLYQEKRIRTCLQNQFILEVKFNDYYPAWMKPIIGILGLKWTSASKYVISMDAHQIGYKTEKSVVISQGKMFDRLSRYQQPVASPTDSPEAEGDIPLKGPLPLNPLPRKVVSAVPPISKKPV
jgi:hypothetical protein